MIENRVVVVTGAAGYIGQSLISRLVQEGANVIGIDRVSVEAADASVEWVQLDISAPSSRDDLDNVLRRADIVFHLAAARADWGLEYSEYERDNVLATRNLVQVARSVGSTRWVYFGTVGVYGSSETPLDESAPFCPETDYGKTKAQAEHELLDTASKEGWNVRAIRPSAVFSEEQPENTNLYRLIEAIRRNRFMLIGDGSEIKTTSYLHNVVDATVWLCEDILAGGIEAYNYIDEPRLTTRQMIHLIRAEVGSRLPLIRLPLSWIEPPARILDHIAEHLGRDLPITAARIRKFCTATNFEASKIRRSGFRPRYSSYEALRRTVRWHQGRRVEKLEEVTV